MKRFRIVWGCINTGVVDHIFVPALSVDHIINKLVPLQVRYPALRVHAIFRVR